MGEPAANEDINLCQLNQIVKIREVRANGMGCEIWASSQMLFSWLKCELRDFNEYGFVEIGAGTGIVSIGLALDGAQVIATDYDQVAIRNLKHNMHLNNVGGQRCRALRWDWSTGLPAEIGDFNFDYLLASDIAWGHLDVSYVCGLAHGVRKVLDAARLHKGFMVNLVRQAGEASNVNFIPIACAAAGVDAEEVPPEQLPPRLVEEIQLQVQGESLPETIGKPEPGDVSWTKYRFLKLSLRTAGPDENAMAELRRHAVMISNFVDEDAGVWDLGPGESTDDEG